MRGLQSFQSKFSGQTGYVLLIYCVCVIVCAHKYMNKHTCVRVQAHMCQGSSVEITGQLLSPSSSSTVDLDIKDRLPSL